MQYKQQSFRHFRLFSLLALLAVLLQGCIGGPGDFQDRETPARGDQVKVNTSQEARFRGSVYFTLDRNLYVLDGNGNLTQLTQDMDVRDPAISPDGKWVAFIRRFKHHSDLVYRSTNPDQRRIYTVVTGEGAYYPHKDGKNSYYWFAQPAWSADSKRLVFLSDLHKDFFWKHLGGPYASAPFLDLQVFTLPMAVSLTAERALQEARPVGYAVYGDGGNRDPAFRPGHPEQILYTTYKYDQSGTKQVVQLVLVDTTMMTGAQRWKYHPGLDPSVPLTPEKPDLVNFQPAFAPDGKSVAYVRRESATSMGLYVMPVAEDVANDPDNASKLRQALEPYEKSTRLLTQQFVSQPVWAPDGRYILYYSHANDSFDIWMAEVSQDKKTGTYHLKPDSAVQITQASGHLDADSRASWRS